MQAIYTTTSAAETEAVGERIGKHLRGGEVVELASDLGGGKTTFVRGLAHGAGSTDHVASPTFTISREYRAEQVTVYHFDFYRLSQAGLMAEELRSALDDPRAVVVVEWADIVDHVLPDERLAIRIEATGDTARTLICHYPSRLAYLFTETT